MAGKKAADPAGRNDTRLPLFVLILLAGIAVLFLGTAAHFLVRRPSPFVYHLLHALDLNAWRGNGATWFQSFLFLCCGVSFARLSLNRGSARKIHVLFKGFFLLLFLLFLYFSLDELFSLHKFLSRLFEKDTGIGKILPLFGGGESWILFYAPAAVLGLAFLAATHFSLLARIEDRAGTRRRARRFFFAAMAMLFMDLLFEMGEALGKRYGFGTGLLSLLEETAEMMTLWCFIVCNTFITRGLLGER